MARCETPPPRTPGPEVGLAADPSIDCGEGRGCGIICESEVRPNGANCCVAICEGEEEPRISVGCNGDDAPQGEVHVSIQDLPLVRAATLLDSVLPYQCYVPVARLEERVQLSMTGTLEEAGRHLGIRFEQHEDSDGTYGST